MSPEQQWPKAAAMVMDGLDRHEKSLEKLNSKMESMQTDIMKQLTHIQLALVSSGNETNGRIKSLEQSVEHATGLPGSSETCQEHSRQLTRLAERVDQHARMQTEKFQHVALNKQTISELHQRQDELGKLLASVDKEGSNLWTQWHTVAWIFGASAFGSGLVWLLVTFVGRALK